MSSTWLTVRVIATFRSARNASRVAPGSNASTRARMMESGVRSCVRHIGGEVTLGFGSPPRGGRAPG